MHQTIVAVFLLLLLHPFQAFAKFDPSFVWTTMETPHFLIHHHQGGEELAKRAAVLAEDIHSRLVPRIRWEPKNKTHLVLVDAMDEANGYSTPIPYNEVVIFLTAPSGEQSLGLVSYDDWLRLVITHEYVHTLQLDMVRRGPALLQKILGRIYFPNLFQPLWMIEGLATYEETEQTSGGRGRSAWKDMVFRAATLENTFPDLSQASTVPDTWPDGLVPYLFGEGFVRYLAKTYGRERLADLSAEYSGRYWPFLVQSTGRRVLKREYRDLWFEWQSLLRDRYQRQKKELESQGLTQSKALTSRGYINMSPAYSPDGSNIAYAAVYADEYPGLHIMNADGSGDRRVAENVFPSSVSGSGLAWSPGGERVYYTAIDFQKNANYFSDISSYDLKKQCRVAITRGLRAHDPHVSPDGKELLFVMNRMGMTRLATTDLPTQSDKPARERDVRPLSDWSTDQYASPRYSPDGTRIAVKLWRPGGIEVIRILDRTGAVLSEVAPDRSKKGAPAWSPDGKRILFSSDSTGVFNIYSYELETGRMQQITNVLGGAFSPALSPDGKTLVFASYSARGYDIHAMTIDPVREKEAAPYRDAYPVMKYDETPVDTVSRPYSPLSTIYPRFWLPWFGYSEDSGTMFGAVTFGQDAVQRHSYTATGFYGPQKSRYWYSVDYLYDGLYPTIHLAASDSDVVHGGFFENGMEDVNYVEREKVLGADLIIPLLKNARQQAWTLGIRRRELTALTDLPPWTGYTGVLPMEGTLASGRLSWLYNSSRRYALSISPEDGRTLDLGAERFTTALGSDLEYTKYTADWHEYLDLPAKHQVLLARFFAGTSTGDAPPQGAYQLGGDNPGDVTLTLNDQMVTLRGYPANVMRGNTVALAGLEYRFPIRLLDKGWNTKALYFRKLHGAVFYEAGSAWDGTLHRDFIRKSAGAELRLDTDLAYYLPVTFRVVAVKGLDEDGIAGTYIGLWVALAL